MCKKFTLTFVGILITFASYCQINRLIVPKNIHIVGDSIQVSLLVNSLEGLLKQTINANKVNAFVLKDNLLETSLVLDEIKGMENGSGTGMNNIYKCYLTDATLLDSSKYSVQFVYLGGNEPEPVLRANFKLMAKKTGDHYSFYSPLKINTSTWQVKKTGKFIFYYRESLNRSLVGNYVKKAAEFDKKLHAPDYITQIYFCDDLPKALEVLGITYKADYNGIAHDNFSSTEDGNRLLVFGTSSSDTEALDIHDCWHLRLRHVVPLSTINRPVDEGCAYLYGGSWGYSWQYIFKQFKVFMGTDKDWLKAFTENKNFGTSQQYHLYVSYVINALIVQKIEKDKGFPAVMELLSCGKKQKDDENYFSALNKIDGINRANFNMIVEKLVKEETAN
jgi:hypothetical protein